MREKPNLEDAEIKACLNSQYGLQIDDIAFLPQGGDINAAVYHLTTGQLTHFFMKLRSDALDEIALIVPKFLYDLRITGIIAPIPTSSGRLWTQLNTFYLILYPFIEGHNAFEAHLSQRQWVDFGAALKAVHSTVVPAELNLRLRREDYAPDWREKTNMLLNRARQDHFDDTTAAQYAEFMTLKAEEIHRIVQRAEQLGSVLKAQDPDLVLCHSDIHAGNLLVDANGSLFIVDWDDPILAPKERDLMFIGGGVGSTWYQPDEKALFYAGYGPAAIDPVALAYYRHERIVQDIAEWGERMLLTDAGGPDRARWLQGLFRWFQPQDVVAMAYQAEKALPPELRSLKA